MENWVEEILRLNQTYGVKILGGCGGTDENYLGELIAEC